MEIKAYLFSQDDPGNPDFVLQQHRKGCTWGSSEYIKIKKGSSINMHDILILVMALCIDTFVASVAYGADRLHISFIKVTAVNGICSGGLGGSLTPGRIHQWIGAGRTDKGIGLFWAPAVRRGKAYGLYD